MAKLYSFNMITLNGLFEGPTPWSIEWHTVDQEFNDFAIAQLETIGALIFGRTTYEGMAAYWPSPEGIQDDPQIARMMNAMPKIVVSRTLERADWSNTRVIANNLADEITRLKKESDKDVAVFGSANLLGSLTKLGLVDEHRLLLSPIVLERGTPLFQGIDGQLKLNLLESRTFKNGNVLLRYAVTA
ncbi:MAG: dihydrofolate reductase [Chloroflexi bacterium]|nr:dihydrofolate reductase [Chloroflexota bacterium]